MSFVPITISTYAEVNSEDDEEDEGLVEEGGDETEVELERMTVVELEDEKCEELPLMLLEETVTLLHCATTVV